MSSINAADLIADMKRIMASVPPIDRRSVVLNPADVRAFEAAAPPVDWDTAAHRKANPNFIMGFPVVLSDAIPRGEIVFAKVETPTFRFRPILVDDVASFRVPRRLLRRGYSSRRPAVKRWIRNEIAARRLARALEG